jgi:hypothetical protein
MVTYVRPRRSQRTPQPQGQSRIEEIAGRWYTNYTLAKQITAQQEKDGIEGQGYRLWLLEQIRNIGRTIANGHKVVIFDRPVHGLYGLKAQRSAGPEFNVLVAAGLLTKKGEDVKQACLKTRYAFRSDKISTIVQALEDAGVLEECLEEGYPKMELDPDLIMRQHQLHPDVITEADMDLMLPDVETWSIHPITQPWRDVPDVD